MGRDNERKSEGQTDGVPYQGADGVGCDNTAVILNPFVYVAHFLFYDIFLKNNQRLMILN